MKPKPTQKQVIGTLGEAIASRFIINKGFTVVSRNYRKKFGEIDIIAKKSGKIHFVEVKTVSRENLKETAPESGDGFRPEDNVHPWKLKRLSRAIQVYLSENKLEDEADWQLDVVTVMLDVKNKVARVKMLEDIIL
ncbi:MAG: YraN family protein [Candidatus Taylorbacteria bacterium]|nr:YraN family protein [Candidatus Taylorbacteria bacterium]